MSIPLPSIERVAPAGLRLISTTSPAPSRPIVGTAASSSGLVSLWRAADRLAIALVFVVILTLTVSGRLPGPATLQQPNFSVLSVLGLLLFLLYWETLAALFGFYDERWLLRAEYTSAPALGCLAGSIPLALLPLPHGGRVLGLEGALMFGAAAALAISVVRLAGQLMQALCTRRRLHHVLIIGSGPRALEAFRQLSTQPGRAVAVIGFLDDRVQSGLSGAGIPNLGKLQQLESVLEQQVVDEVHVALPVKSCYAEFQRLITICERAGAVCTYPLDTFVHQSAHGSVDVWGEQLRLRLDPVPTNGSLLVKRAFDVIIATLGLFLLSPLMAVVALGVKLTSPGPVFFAQARYGRHKRLFRMYKFRSMRADAEEILRRDATLYSQYCRNNFKLPESKDPRLTWLGRFIRKTSIDELPQLWNVLRGDMSIVGPRPIVPAELAHYGPGAYLLLALKPGLTSAWVLGGRSTVGYPHRARLELGYVRSWSLWRDASIFLRTVPYVLTGRGAY